MKMSSNRLNLCVCVSVCACQCVWDISGALCHLTFITIFSIKSEDGCCCIWRSCDLSAHPWMTFINLLSLLNNKILDRNLVQILQKEVELNLVTTCKFAFT